jgi:hypothetical protein
LLRAAVTPPEQVLASLSDIVIDSVSSVRCALAVSLGAHAVFEDPNRKEFFLANIAPLLLDLLADSNDDVRIATSASLRDLIGVFDLSIIFDNLSEHIRFVLTDLEWRVRRNGVRLFCSLSLVCSPRYFDVNGMPFIVRALCDDCTQIRLFTISQLPFLVQRFGGKWLMKSLLPRLQDLNVSSNYLWRQTYLLSIVTLVDRFPADLQAQLVFQPIVRALRDPVYCVVVFAMDLLSAHITEIHPFKRQAEITPILESIFVDSPPTIIEKANALLSSCR